MIGSFQLYVTNVPEGTYAWAIRSYDQAVQQWRDWQSGIPIDQNFYISNIELNSYWVLVRCQAATISQYGPYGPFDLQDGGVYTINAQTGAMQAGPPPEPGAGKASIQIVDYPDSLQAGQEGAVHVLVRNIGGQTAVFTIWDFPGDWQLQEPLYDWLAVGEQKYFTVLFTMPNNDVQFNVSAGHYNFDTAQWVLDDTKGPFTVMLISAGAVKNLDCNYVKA